jgi:hypothetical protein
MTPPSPRPVPSTSLPRARKRRIKRGIYAGYIHDISARHRAAEPVLPTIEVTPLTPAAPAPALTVEQALPVAPPAP